MKANTNHEQLLAKANEAVFETAKQAGKDRHRLAYHIMAPANWINDPNGLVQYQGEYHVFYQHHPYSPEWGPMHWGHVKSKDLVHWEHLPIAIAPSEIYDDGGCFSGSAVDDNGTLTLIYTGNIPDRNPSQIQNIAVSTDGFTFTKYERNPVVSHPPAEGSNDFRDPKVWKHDGVWYMVVGSGKDGVGKALLYRSSDLRSWDYVGVLAESDGTQGYMWECPDLFPLGDKHVLVISPMGMEGHKNMYIVGSMDYGTGKFTQEYIQEIDHGFDFYAAQTFDDNNGRRILIGWMNMWGTKQPTREQGWSGALTIPREIKMLPDGKIAAFPVQELQKLRDRHIRLSDFIVSSESKHTVSGVDSDCLEIIVKFNLSSSSAAQFGLHLRRSLDGQEQTTVLFDRSDQTVILDRSKSDSIGDGGIRRCRLEQAENLLELHLFLDKSSVELFADHGRVVMSNRIYPRPDSVGISLFALNGTVRVESLDIWTLQSGWLNDQP